MTNRRNVLFVHYGDNWIRGSERCLLDLISNLDRTRYTPFVWTNSKALASQLKLMTVHCELSKFSVLFGEKAPRFDLSAWKALVSTGRQYIRRASIDLVHVNSGAPCQWMCTAARLEKTRLVTQLHADYSARDRLTLGLHASPYIITVSKAISQNLLRDGYPEKQLSVIHNGIDVQRLESHRKQNIRHALSLPKDSYVITTVGSLIERKGVDRIIGALRYITLEFPNTHLVVIGEGPQRDKLEQSVDYLNLAGNVHFVGEQANVMGWLNDSDAFVSGARQEAFGLVIAEAALASLPIIAPYEGGIKEILTHKNTALMYKNTGIRRIVNAIRYVIKNPNQSAAMGVRAKQHILNKHTIAANTANIENVYQQVINQSSLASPSMLTKLSPIKTYLAKQFRVFGGVPMGDHTHG